MITQQTKNSIIKDYHNQKSITSISTNYKIGRYIIRKLLVENGIEIRSKNTWTRKYSFDFSFFKKINTQEKAYWLGFLYADGCIAKSSVNLSIDQTDIEALEKFKTDIQFTGPIELRTDYIDQGEKYGIVESKMAKVRISGMELREDLIKLGCVPRKTFVLKFPNYNQVPKRFMRHFIRGYFDGDGSIYERKYKRKDGAKRGFAQITSSNHMIKGIKKFLVKECKIKSKSINIKPHPTSYGISILMIASFPGMLKFRDFLYKEATVFLNRKKDKFYSLNLDFIPTLNINYSEKIINFLKKESPFTIAEISRISGCSRFIVRRAFEKLKKDKIIVYSHFGGGKKGLNNAAFYKLK